MPIDWLLCCGQIPDSCWRPCHAGNTRHGVTSPVKPKEATAKCALTLIAMSVCIGVCVCVSVSVVSANILVNIIKHYLWICLICI